MCTPAHASAFVLMCMVGSFWKKSCAGHSALLGTGKPYIQAGCACGYGAVAVMAVMAVMTAFTVRYIGRNGGRTGARRTGH